MTPKQDIDGTWRVEDVHGCVWCVHMTYDQAKRFIAVEAEYAVDRGEDVHDWAIRMKGNGE